MIKLLSSAAIALFLSTSLAQAATPADAAGMSKEACEKQAGEKKLHGAAKNSFVKKCSGGGAAAASPAAAACDQQAAEKKLHGAAKNSFVKKCTAEPK